LGLPSFYIFPQYQSPAESDRIFSDCKVAFLLSSVLRPAAHRETASSQARSWTLTLMTVFHAKQVALDVDEWMAAVD
jgi:hypothetical protein